MNKKMRIFILVFMLAVLSMYVSPITGTFTSDFFGNRYWCKISNGSLEMPNMACILVQEVISVSYLVLPPGMEFPIALDLVPFDAAHMSIEDAGLAPIILK